MKKVKNFIWRKGTIKNFLLIILKHPLVNPTQVHAIGYGFPV